MERNAINYTCQCGRKWQRQYYIETKGTIVYLSRIVARGTPPNDALCTCGKQAEGSLETPMPAGTHVKVRLITPVPPAQAESSQEHYEELVQHFLAQETFISWEHLDEIEERAAKLVEQGWTPATWQRLTSEQQAKVLGITF